MEALIVRIRKVVGICTELGMVSPFFVCYPCIFVLFTVLLGTITNCFELFRILKERMGSKHSIVLATYKIG